jgi:AraC-like DNA-binding protein/mannose-6-phosphate isomerase-like protein (cupin superfamily)
MSRPRKTKPPTPRPPRAARAKQQQQQGQQPEPPPLQLEPIWSQEPLNRRETYEAPRTLISEIAIVGQIGLQQAVPRALGQGSHPNEFELHLVRDGRMRLWIDSPKRIFELHGGMASLTQPGQMHSGEGELMLPGRWMWLQFRVPAAGDERDARAERAERGERGERDTRTAQGGRGGGGGATMPGLSARETAVLYDGLASVKPPVFHYSPDLEHCMERLLAEHRRPTPESAIVARGILHELIAWIIRDYRAEQLRRDREPAGYSPPITKVMAWLSEHLDENAAVSDLADVAGLSPSYFRRWFHREVGSSPRDYVTQMRIERAKRLLGETDRSITEIAMELGYSTSAYFTAVFHRETGTTPSDFRRPLRAASATLEKPPNRNGHDSDDNAD